MLKYSLLHRARQFATRIPGARQTNDFLRTTLTPTYREDGLVTTHKCDFMKDPEFVEAYSRAERQHYLPYIHWRAYVTQWAGFHAKQLDGDFVECGVNRGFFSMGIMTYIDFASMSDRKFYLFDTYDGLVPEMVSAEDKAAYRWKYEDCYDFVKKSFAEFPNAEVVRGAVPDSLSSADIQKVAYLCLDMNCTQPEVEALKHFWPLMVTGGLVILDDYGFPGHEAQKTGLDQVAESFGVKILSLPTGQGFMVKP